MMACPIFISHQYMYICKYSMPYRLSQVKIQVTTRSASLYLSISLEPLLHTAQFIDFFPI